MVCTPIFINTFVVFVRLYWFERRFQNVFREARNFPRTKSRSRTEPKDNLDSNVTEKGVRGRSIIVLHNGDLHASSNSKEIKTGKHEASKNTSDRSRTACSRTQGDNTEAVDHAVNLLPQQPPTFRRDITFADEVTSSEGDGSRPTLLPQRLSPEEQINFLENQRNPKDKGALRIPGPRDFDRGSVPEPLDDEDDGRQLTNQPTSPLTTKDIVNEDRVKRNVTIDEPDHPRPRMNSSTFPKLSTRKSGTLEKLSSAPIDDINTQPNRLRAHTSTFSSLRGLGTKENEPRPTSYLSWQPTLGRNSNFIDLTEEQREELGGIEYRSLKTLAVILVCKSITLMRLTIHPTNSVTCLEGYYVLFHLVGVVILVPWINCTDTWGSIIDSDGQSRTWWYGTRREPLTERLT